MAAHDDALYVLEAGERGEAAGPTDVFAAIFSAPSTKDFQLTRVKGGVAQRLGSEAFAETAWLVADDRGLVLGRAGSMEFLDHQGRLVAAAEAGPHFDGGLGVAPSHVVFRRHDAAELVLVDRASGRVRALREVDDVPVGCTETHLVWGDEFEAGIRVATIDDPAAARWLELPERVRHVTTGHGQVGLVLRRGLARLDEDLGGARLLHPDASFGRLAIGRDAWFVERGGQLAYTDAGEEKTGPAILTIDPGRVHPPREVWTAAPGDGPGIFGVLRSQPPTHWTVSAAGLVMVTATRSGSVVARVRG